DLGGRPLRRGRRGGGPEPDQRRGGACGHRRDGDPQPPLAAEPVGLLTPTNEELGRPRAPWRRRLHEVIFESETPAGRRFDKWIVAAILVSVAVVVVDSVPTFRLRFGTALDATEWFFTLLFTVEYLARLAGVRNQLRYAFSFFGIVDLLSVLPT